MKKLVIIALIAVISLFILCSCGENAPAKSEIAVTYTDIYEANTYAYVTSNHSSVLMKDFEYIADGEYVDCEYYWTKSGLADKSYQYTDEEGNSARYLLYITDSGSYFYFQTMTEEQPTYDILECYAAGGISSVEDISMFGLISSEYNQKITECQKTDNGYEITGENSAMDLVSTFCEAFFPDRECAEGDKIQFKMVLNEKLEMLKYENYYVFADGTETVMTNYGEFAYDVSDVPDFMTNINTVLENGAKNISVKVYTENEVVERMVYSDIFLLYTDYDVYTDAEYTDLLPNDAGYYMFETSEDITLYLKTPTEEQ